MQVRHAVHPEQAATMDSQALRDHFLVDALFKPGRTKLIYSHNDRLIVGGVCPKTPLSLEADPKIIGADFLLERREMGVINVGDPGTITIDGNSYFMDFKSGLYIGKGSKNIIFESNDPSKPAHYYVNSAPAHAVFPTCAISFDQIEPEHLGEMELSNKRNIRKYFHPGGISTCQLVMGMTTLETGSVWNTMPVHTHERRMEAYFYFNMEEEQVVFHFMGQPFETRHIVMRNHEAVLSPSWSIHSGAGTGSYTFIWGMAGENQTFTDMDSVLMQDLK
ncbi:MAG: 5-dehydro-4-deoxy-D-glucuronate isomerase [Desulfobacteraceae bacterium]|nr:5-dehydro-4-deoxy-D-glucuronate isomerase [Desulfobacteraceae bacterium]